MRLLFWHLLQPIAYAVVLTAYASKISRTQFALALIVGGREISYVLVVLFALDVHPAFLLVDLTADVRGMLDNGKCRKSTVSGGALWERCFLPRFAFVVMPEKWVLWTVRRFLRASVMCLLVSLFMLIWPIY